MSELESEVGEECANYGRVLQCKAVELSISQESRDDYAVRIFLVFENIRSASAAVAAMEGRFFAGKRVAASYVNQDTFAKGNLTI